MNKENFKPYVPADKITPEFTITSVVMGIILAGEEGGASAKSVFAGMGLAAAFKFLVDGIKVVPGVITAPINALKTELSAEVYPALIGVGYICGLKISAFMFAGGVIGWFVLIPAIVTFGGETILYPGTDTIATMYAAGGASAIWSSYVRYIGAGAVAAGGIISLIKSLPLIVTTFVDAIKGMKGSKSSSTLRTDQDLDMRIIGIGVLLMILAIWLFPQVPVTLLGAVLIVLFGFFFATVSSRMVGLVGSSNNPVSGMAIATLLFATICLKATGDTGVHGMGGAIAIGSIICIVAAMAGDTSQDLKTGYILGATPKEQQIGELIGSFVSALAIGGVLILLNSAWGFGTTELSAPQATLMKMIIEGVMDGNLPWSLVFIGVFIAIAVEILGISVLPVAIGLYLPLELSSTIMIGGLIRWFVDKKTEAKKQKEAKRTGNYLDLIPVPKDGLKWERTTEDITIFIENKGIMNRIAQKLFHKPKVSQIHLDEMGTFIFPLMDGTRSIYDIAQLVKEEFGPKAEPLYNRIVQYMHTLEGYEFVIMKNRNE